LYGASFPPTTPVRNGTHGNYQPLSNINWETPIPPSSSTEQSTEWKDGNDDGGVAAGIAALKSQSHDTEEETVYPQPPPPPPEPPTAPTESSVQDRINALRNSHIEHPSQPAVLESPGEDGVAARIAALKQGSMTTESATLPQPPPPPPPPPPAPPAPPVPAASPINTGSSVQDRINALRNSHTQQPSKAAPGNRGEDGVAARIASLKQSSANSMQKEGEEALYPIPEPSMMEDVPYPVEDASYPIPEEDGEAYPVTGDYPIEAHDSYNEYPNHDYPAVASYPPEETDDSYPVIGTYPAEDLSYPPPPLDGISQNSSAGGREAFVPSYQAPATTPKKKEFKGDKTVLKGLVPSNLQRRRPATTNDAIMRKKRRTGLKVKHVHLNNDNATILRTIHSHGKDDETKPSKTSVKDDYDKFMEEINAME